MINYLKTIQIVNMIPKKIRKIVKNNEGILSSGVGFISIT